MKFVKLGLIDYGYNYNLLYEINMWIDVIPNSIGNLFFFPNNYMSAYSSGSAMRHNTNLFGIINGLNFTLQYQDINQDGR